LINGSDLAERLQRAVPLIRGNVRAAELDLLTQGLVGYRRRRQHLRQIPP
jgi:hypothetical protein